MVEMVAANLSPASPFDPRAWASAKPTRSVRIPQCRHQSHRSE